MTYEQWQNSVPLAIREDVIWTVEAYRLALFLGELAWHDVTKLASDGRTRDIADQLYRATGKISANISEGYSRGSAKARAAFNEYAIGSTRESRDWYYKARHVLGPEVTDHRVDLCTQILRLTITMVANERRAGTRLSAGGR